MIARSALTANLLACFVCFAPLAVAAQLAPPELAFALAERSSAGAVVAVDGVVEAEHQAVVAAQVAGRIVERKVEGGAAVRQGQLLLRIDDRASAQASSASSAQLAVAETQLAQAKLDFDRSKAMLERQLISRAAFDQAETRYRSALADVRAVRAGLEISQTQQSFTQVLSPYDGLVADVQVNVGDLALPGKPLLTVYDPSAFRVFAKLSLSLLNRWQRQQAIAIELGDGRVLAPAAVVVQPTAEAQAQQVSVRFDLPPAAGALLPGTLVKVRLPIATEARILVPVQVLLQRGEMVAVYVVREGFPPQLRQVRAGKVLGDRVEILAGLDQGERVALDPVAAAQRRVDQRGPHGDE